MYYGVLLYVDRNPEKVKPKAAPKSEKFDPYFKIDRISFVIYISAFLIFNVATVVKYVDKIMWLLFASELYLLSYTNKEML